MSEATELDLLDVSGEVRANGTWTIFGIHRLVPNTGNASDRFDIVFDPKDKAGSPFSVRVRLHRKPDGDEILGDEIKWIGNDSSAKPLATGVRPGTDYTLDARGSGGETLFTGRLSYIRRR